MKNLFILLCLASPCFAAAKHAGFSDPLLNDEFANVYKEIGTVLKGDVRISSVTISSLTLNNLYTGIALGKVKQIVQGTSTSGTSTTSTSYVDTNTTLTITPTAATSKVLLIASGYMLSPANGNNVYATLTRTTTNLLSAEGGCVSLFGAATAQIRSGCSLTFLDSPATTSATTYKVQIKVGGGTGAWCDTNTTTSVITAIEYAP